MSGIVTAPPLPPAERGELVALAGELARQELVPRAAELDEADPVAIAAAWERLAAVGFDRALLGAEQGGPGIDAGSLLACLEELAAGDAGAALLVLLANAALVALPPAAVADAGPGERRVLVPVPAPPQRGLSPAGEAAEPGARRGRRLSGTVAPVLGALGAATFVVISDDPPVATAVPADASGVRLEPCEPLLGLRAAAPAALTLDDLDAAALPRGEADQAAGALALLDAGVAAIARGIARRARELALAYARERVQGGVAIVQHDAVREMLAAMTVREAALAAPPGAGLDRAAAAAAKVAASTAALASATDAVQVFGGAGYMRETGVEKLMRDAKCTQLWPQPNWLNAARLVAAAPAARQAEPADEAGAPRM